LSDFLDWADFFFVDLVQLDDKAKEKLEKRDCREDFKNLASRFETISDFSPQHIEEIKELLKS